MALQASPSRCRAWGELRGALVRLGYLCAGRERRRKARPKAMFVSLSARRAEGLRHRLCAEAIVS